MAHRRGRPTTVIGPIQNTRVFHLSACQHHLNNWNLPDINATKEHDFKAAFKSNNTLKCRLFPWKQDMVLFATGNLNFVDYKYSDKHNK